VTTKTKPWLSGYCNPSNDAASHSRCHAANGDTPCSCGCHTDDKSGAPVPTKTATKKQPELRHGFIEDLPEADYHGDRTTLSHSGAKQILRSPEHFQWALDHPVHKDVFDFGSAAHALVLDRGMEDIYVAPYDDWTRRRGPEGGVQYTTDEKKIGRADGYSVILPKDWLVVCDMADKLSTHTLAMELLSEGRPELSAYAPDPITGVQRRCRFDYLTDDFGIDYKSTVCSDPHQFVATAPKLKYHMQHPFYVDIARDLDHPLRGFLFIAQEKEPPYTVTVIELPADLVRAGRELAELALERYAACVKSGRWGGYVPDDTIATAPAPSWALFNDRYSQIGDLA
jgi:hypothetical protein